MIIRCREFVYVSNYRLKIPIVNHLFSDRADGTDGTDQQVISVAVLSMLSRRSRNESLYYRWCIDLSIGTSGEELFTDGKLPLPSVPHARATSCSSNNADYLFHQRILHIHRCRAYSFLHRYGWTTSLYRR